MKRHLETNLGGSCRAFNLLIISLLPKHPHGADNHGSAQEMHAYKASILSQFNLTYSL